MATAAVIVVVIASTVAVALSAETSDAGWAWLSLALVWTVPVFTFTAVGFLLIRRGAGSIIAGLCLGFGVVWSIWSAVDAATVFEAWRPGSISRLDLVLALVFPLWVPGVAAIGFLLLLFPDGRLPSRRLGPILWAMVVSSVVLFISGFFVVDYPFAVPWENPLAWDGMTHLLPLTSAMVVVLAASLVASAVSLIVRYRGAEGIERLQLKWLVAAGGASAVVYPLLFLWEIPIQLIWSVIPAAIGIAILRYRLYEIDRLVSRSVSYAVVVTVSFGVFFGGVFLLRPLVPGEGDLAVAASTLAVAALFNPMRRRVKMWVDRRFNRSRYDAERLVETFAQVLRGRVDPEDVVMAWITVVSETMQPASAGVWLRDGRS